MPDIETIIEPKIDDRQRDREIPNFESADLLTVIDDMCGTCYTYYCLSNILFEF